MKMMMEEDEPLSFEDGSLVIHDDEEEEDDDDEAESEEFEMVIDEGRGNNAHGQSTSSSNGGNLSTAADTDEASSPFSSFFTGICGADGTPASLGPIFEQDIVEKLWTNKELGVENPKAMLLALWFYFSWYFGIGSRTDHARLLFGNVLLTVNSAGKKQLEFVKMTDVCGPGTRHIPVTPRFPPRSLVAMEDNPDRCPVRIYESFVVHRPPSTDHRDSPFYLQPEKDYRRRVNDVWFTPSGLGKNKIGGMLNSALKRVGLPTMRHFSMSKFYDGATFPVRMVLANSNSNSSTPTKSSSKPPTPKSTSDASVNATSSNALKLKITNLSSGRPVVVDATGSITSPTKSISSVPTPPVPPSTLSVGNQFRKILPKICPSSLPQLVVTPTLTSGFSPAKAGDLQAATTTLHLVPATTPTLSMSSGGSSSLEIKRDEDTVIKVENNDNQSPVKLALSKTEPVTPTEEHHFHPIKREAEDVDSVSEATTEAATIAEVETQPRPPAYNTRRSSRIPTKTKRLIEEQPPSPAKKTRAASTKSQSPATTTERSTRKDRSPSKSTESGGTSRRESTSKSNPEAQPKTRGASDSENNGLSEAVSVSASSTPKREAKLAGAAAYSGNYRILTQLLQDASNANNNRQSADDSSNNNQPNNSTSIDLTADDESMDSTAEKIVMLSNSNQPPTPAVPPAPHAEECRTFTLDDDDDEAGSLSEAPLQIVTSTQLMSSQITDELQRVMFTDCEDEEKPGERRHKESYGNMGDLASGCELGCTESSAGGSSGGDGTDVVDNLRIELRKSVGSPGRSVKLEMKQILELVMGAGEGGQRQSQLVTDLLWRTRALGDRGPWILIFTVWWMIQSYFGVGSRMNHVKLRWGHFRLVNDVDPRTKEESECIEYCGPPSYITSKTALLCKKVYPSSGRSQHSDPESGPDFVALYKLFSRRRQMSSKQPDSPFYLQPLQGSAVIRKQQIWFSESALGKNRIGALMRNIVEKVVRPNLPKMTGSPEVSRLLALTSPTLAALTSGTTPAQPPPNATVTPGGQLKAVIPKATKSVKSAATSHQALSSLSSLATPISVSGAGATGLTAIPVTTASLSTATSLRGVVLTTSGLGAVTTTAGLNKVTTPVIQVVHVSPSTGRALLLGLARSAGNTASSGSAATGLSAANLATIQSLASAANLTTTPLVTTSTAAGQVHLAQRPIQPSKTGSSKPKTPRGYSLAAVMSQRVMTCTLAPKDPNPSELKTLQQVVIESTNHQCAEFAQYVEELWRCGALGCQTPWSLNFTTWFINTLVFGVESRNEHLRLKWGDFKLCTTSEGREFIYFINHVTKETHYLAPNEPGVEEDKCPLMIFKCMRDHRPKICLDAHIRFYLQPRSVVHLKETVPWFTEQGWGKNKLGGLLADAAQMANLPITWLRKRRARSFFPGALNRLPHTLLPLSSSKGGGKGDSVPPLRPLMMNSGPPPLIAAPQRDDNGIVLLGMDDEYANLLPPVLQAAGWEASDEDDDEDFNEEDEVDEGLAGETGAAITGGGDFGWVEDEDAGTATITLEEMEQAAIPVFAGAGDGAVQTTTMLLPPTLNQTVHVTVKKDDQHAKEDAAAATNALNLSLWPEDTADVASVNNHLHNNVDEAEPMEVETTIPSAALSSRQSRKRKNYIPVRL